MGRDTQTGEIVAIKMVNASNFRSITEIELVQEEMRVLSALKHPHIIRLMDVLYVGNCIYFGASRACASVTFWAPHSKKIEHFFPCPSEELTPFNPHFQLIVPFPLVVHAIYSDTSQ